MTLAKTMNSTNTTIPKHVGIHNGANTHHQDQVITLHNFNTKNMIVSNVGNGIDLYTIFVFSVLIII